MTTVALAPDITRRQGSSAFAGTGILLRLCLRRDRLVLPLWSVVLGALMVAYPRSVADIYRTPADLAHFAATTNHAPALVALYGPVLGTTLGAVSIWKASMFFSIIGVATALTVIRHTRTEEETGRSELVGSTQVGRAAGLTAAVGVAVAGSAVAGITCAVSLAAAGLPAAGSAWFAAALTGSGLAWAGVAAAAAQLSASARLARGIALGAVATMFVVRAVGDTRGDVLSFLAPQGWCIHLQPYAHTRWWVVPALVALAAAGTAAGYLILVRRDLGSGIIAERPGREAAPSYLGGPTGLAWRLHRGPLAAWTIGLSLYGALIGSAARGIGGLLGSGNAVTDTLVRAGGSGGVTASFLGAAFGMFGIAAAGYAISATLRLHDEETSGRAEAALAGSVGRLHWAATHLLFAVLGPAVALSASGAVAGLVYGADSGDIAHQVPRLVAAAAVQLPVVWLFSALAVALLGFIPRGVGATWALFCAAVIGYVLTMTDTIPRWMSDLVPFHHIPALPGAHFRLTPLLWLLLAAGLLFVAGLSALRRRDLS